MSTSVLRRYTPPTCTLEIAATGSALSRWTDRAVLKHLRFQLSFDDPTVPEDRQVTIRGDRTQLEALWETVSAYIQSLLNQTPEPMEQVMASPALEERHLSPGISLRPKGLLRHDLDLGALANEQSGSVVALSTLQLFDLANALDEYHAESLTLPALGRPAWSKSRGSWAGIAAGLLLAVGSTAALMRFVTVVSTPSSQVADSASEVDPNLQAKSSARLPAPGLEPLPSAAALQPLPPPPPVGATKNAAPPQRVTVPATVPSPSPAAPLLPPATLSNGQVAVIPQPAQPPAASVPLNPQGNPQVGDGTSIASLPTLRAAAPNDAAAQSSSLSAEQGAVSTPNGTAFDAIPQVAEVRSYFQQRWQPPQGLTQTLEYRLVLNGDGSLQRILPLGQSAATFLDRTSMPLMNEPFVSPIENGSNPEIRLVLGQDGRVQTFLEGGN